MTAASPTSGGDSQSIEQFVDKLIGPDVDAPEMKAALVRMMAPTLDVISGQKSGIDFLVENSGVDEPSVIDVLMALQSMPMPDVVTDRLIAVGFAQDDIHKVDIGVKRVAMALVGQHVGLLKPKCREGSAS